MARSTGDCARFCVDVTDDREFPEQVIFAFPFLRYLLKIIWASAGVIFGASFVPLEFTSAFSNSHQVGIDIFLRKISKASCASAGVILKSPLTSAYCVQKVDDKDLLLSIVIMVSELNVLASEISPSPFENVS